MAGMLVAPPCAVLAQQEPGNDETQPAPSDFPISTFVVELYGGDPALLTEADLMNIPLELGEVDAKITWASPDAKPLQATLAELSGPETRQYSIEGLASIIDQLHKHITEGRGIMAVAVAPSQAQVDLEANADRRPPGETSMTIEVLIGRVGQVRSIGSGNRVPADDNVDHPLHEPIRRRSPFQAGEGEENVLKRPSLDDYLYRLNRHPGRRVDAALSRGPNEGEVSLDYLVTENKPWYVYFQLSNTGTESTGDWRERFGFTHTQLTNADDILTLDYSTVGFEDTHAFLGAYERPINERTSFRLRGLYSEFVASDLGLQGEDLSGSEWSVGGDYVYTFNQSGPWFFDFVAGIDDIGITASNDFYTMDPFTGAPGPFTGRANFVVPHFGIEVERLTDVALTNGGIDFSFNVNGNSDADLYGLGRGDPILGFGAPDEYFLIVRVWLEHSFYLEPLLAPKRWKDISDPAWSTLAHEVVTGVQAQLTGNRLVPQMQSVEGGLYTVRGYEEAEVAGDNSVRATVEYRLHLPRLLGWSEANTVPVFGRPFRVTPEAPYGRADWDLQLKAFVDAARITQNDPIPGENDHTLVGAGIGAELSVLNNLTARLDWGFALQDAVRTEAGDSRLHFLLTLLY
jgi:hypothetical protein